MKDRGRIDDDGVFWIEGRSDDVIISAGWTMSAVEIENTLLRHPSVIEAAVVGVPDETRGLVARACIVPRDAQPAFVDDIQASLAVRIRASANQTQAVAVTGERSRCITRRRERSFQA